VTPALGAPPDTVCHPVCPFTSLTRQRGTSDAAARARRCGHSGPKIELNTPCLALGAPAQGAGTLLAPPREAHEITSEVARMGLRCRRDRIDHVHATAARLDCRSDVREPERRHRRAGADPERLGARRPNETDHRTCAIGGLHRADGFPLCGARRSFLSSYHRTGRADKPSRAAGRACRPRFNPTDSLPVAPGAAAAFPRPLAT
jgi:hypothetical protein